MDAMLLENRPATLREAVTAIPDRELDARDFLLVRLSHREEGEGFTVTGCGDLVEMLTHAVWHIKNSAVDEVMN